MSLHVNVEQIRAAGFGGDFVGSIDLTKFRSASTQLTEPILSTKKPSSRFALDTRVPLSCSSIPYIGIALYPFGLCVCLAFGQALGFHMAKHCTEAALSAIPLVGSIGMLSLRKYINNKVEFEEPKRKFLLSVAPALLWLASSVYLVVSLDKEKTLAPLVPCVFSILLATYLYNAKSDPNHGWHYVLLGLGSTLLLVYLTRLSLKPDRGLEWIGFGSLAFWGFYSVNSLLGVSKDPENVTDRETQGSLTAVV